MRKPTNFQRLLREKTLHRYLMAVESVDLAIIEQIWQQATRDGLLEYMLLEAHEVYEQETSALQEEIPMDFKEGVHKSLPQEEPDELPAIQGTPAPQPSRYTRWLQVLAAIVLIALLSGGVLLYTRVHPIASTAHNTQASYKWCVTSGPASDQPALIPALASVAAIAPDNIWAVGNESSQGTTYSNPSAPLIEHWDGAQWSIVLGADTTALYHSLVQRLSGVPSGKITEATALDSISAVSANDIWAVGSITASGPSSSVSHTLIEHWDGQQWRLIAGPDVDPAAVDPAVGYTSLVAIAAVDANDVWVIGQIIPSTSSATPQPSTTSPQVVVDRWDGTKWNTIPLPASSKLETVTSITATAPDNVWVLGQATGEQGSIPLALHWDGQNWHVLAFPPMSPAFFNLHAAPTSSADDLWVTSQAKQAEGTSQPVVEHWDGQQWSALASLKNVQAVQSANLQQETDSTLNAIAVNNPRDVWVAGRTAAGKTLIEHWDGRNWNIASQQLPSPGEINGLVLSGSKVWVVGDRYDNHAQISKGVLIATSCS